MNNLPKYPVYKPSGAEWLGDIPEHWEVKPGFTILFEAKEKNKGMKRDTVLSLSYGKIRVKETEELTGLVPESFETYQFVNKGDIIFRPTDLQNDHVSLRSGISEFEGIITSAYLNLRLRPIADNKFYSYFFRGIDNNKIIYGLGSGLRQNIDFRDFKRFKFPFPPLSEQTAIANFLDRKTALIEQAIGIKEKQIELLKERRQILIHRVVTRGVTSSGVEMPNVKLKDSGVEWIGEIPEHWEVKKLKYLGRIRYGLGQPPKEKENGLPLIRATNVERGIIVAKDLVFVDPEDIPWERDPELKENDIIVVRSGAYTADSAIIPKKYAGSIAGYDMVFTPHTINPLFMSFALLAKYILFDQLYLLRMRAAQPHLNAEELGNTLVLCPPEEEQIFISEYIDNFSHKIATAISLKEKEIEKLKEYKASLINGAVTGKIKVG